MNRNRELIKTTIELAAEYIDLYGKATGFYRHSRGAASVTGAIRELANDVGADANYALRVVEDFIGKDIERWSDSVTQTQVVQTLEIIANELR